jgi:hypothetical protein
VAVAATTVSRVLFNPALPRVFEICICIADSFQRTSWVYNSALVSDGQHHVTQPRDLTADFDLASSCTQSHCGGAQFFVSFG